MKRCCPFLLLFLSLAFAGCASDDRPTSTSSPEDSLADTTSLPGLSLTVFDPAGLGPGDVVDSLRVRSTNLSRAVDDGEWTGEVVFEGKVTVSGSFMLHGEEPASQVPCFKVDNASAPRLPRFPGDERIVWFCFNNVAEAETALAEVGTERSATIVIDDYRTVREFTDVVDTATLVEVVSVEEAPL